MNRRSFLKNIPRGVIILGLGALTGVVLFKDENTLPCDYHFVCNKCKKISECTLNEAVNYKKAHALKSS